MRPRFFNADTVADATSVPKRPQFRYRIRIEDSSRLMRYETRELRNGKAGAKDLAKSLNEFFVAMSLHFQACVVPWQK